MIKYDNNTIYNWNFATSNVIKVYRNNAIVFYKVSGESPTPEWKVCFAVVDDISQYQETEFEDVYDKATEKWYKLNNLNQYEEYGIYGRGRGITYYKGKLTIDEGYEYEWNGSEWVNLGEISRLPQGYTEVEYIENTSTAYIDTDFKPNQDTRIMLTAQTVTSQASGKLIGSGAYNKTNAMQFCYEPSSTGNLVVSWGTVAGWTTYSSCIGDYNVHTYDWNKNEFYRDDTLVGSVTYANFQCTDNLGIFRHIQAGDSPSTAAYFKGKIFNLKIFDNGTLVRDLVPCKRDSDDKYGMYDIANDVFYLSPNNVDFSGGDEISPIEYPKYYTEKSEPLDNLTFNTLAEAQTYAYNNCVYVGLKATINGDRYIFSGDSQRGYEWVYNPSRLPVGYTEVEYIENVTPNKAYIDTGFKPNQKTKTIADFQYVTTNTHPRCFGCGPWNGLAYELNAENGITSNGVWNWKFGQTSGWLTTGVHTDFNRHTAIIDSGKLYLDGTVIGSTTVTTFQLTDNIGLFGFIQNGSQGGTSAGEYMFGKFYSFQIYDNGTLVRDFVPCISPNDVVGMYDVVNDVFYSSANSYNFVSGPEVA